MTALDHADQPSARPSGATVIHVESVSKRFRLYQERPSSLKEALTYRRNGGPGHKDFWAVRDASFDIEAGTTYGLIGHNGSGKSTLLRMIAGIHKPTSGTITTTGRISALLELGAGFHPELTGRENIYLNGSILGLKRREINTVIDDIIQFAGMEQFIDSPVKIYSSGMYVRLGFSVAVHVNPDILLIDEVIAVGDEEFQRRCFEHLYRLRREGVTIVMVSHGSSVIEAMCDQVAWLDHGVIQAKGPASEMIHQYMSRVNEEEANRFLEDDLEHHDEVHDSVHNDASRRGTGEARVDDIEFLDAAGIARPIAETGERLTIRVRFTAVEAIDDPVIGLEFRHESGAHIAGPNTRFGKVSLGTVSGASHVDFVIDRLSLMPGNWRIGVAIVDSKMLHTFDLMVQAFSLHVQPGSSDERYGLIDLHGRWQTP